MLPNALLNHKSGSNFRMQLWMLIQGSNNVRYIMHVSLVWFPCSCTTTTHHRWSHFSVIPRTPMTRLLCKWLTNNCYISWCTRSWVVATDCSTIHDCIPGLPLKPFGLSSNMADGIICLVFSSHAPSRDHLHYLLDSPQSSMPHTLESAAFDQPLWPLVAYRGPLFLCWNGPS
jgi:hypothetical protein